MEVHKNPFNWNFRIFILRIILTEKNKEKLCYRRPKPTAYDFGLCVKRNFLDLDSDE